MALAGPLADQAQADHLSRAGAIRIAAGWALVHGLSVLVIEERLRGIVKRTPAFEELIELADAVVENVWLKVEGE
jgi:hypothetical protein